MKKLNKRLIASLAAAVIITSIGGGAVYAADAMTEEQVGIPIEITKEEAPERREKEFKGECPNLTEEQRTALQAKREELKALIEEFGLEPGKRLSKEDFEALTPEQQEALQAKKQEIKKMMEDLGIKPRKRGCKRNTGYPSKEE